MGFKKRSVYIGYSMEEFNNIREKLASNGFDYTYKVRDRQGGWLTLFKTTRSMTGSVGMDSEYSKEYEIFVEIDKYEEALHCIG